MAGLDVYIKGDGRSRDTPSDFRGPLTLNKYPFVLGGPWGLCYSNLGWLCDFENGYHGGSVNLLTLVSAGLLEVISWLIVFWGSIKVDQIPAGGVVRSSRPCFFFLISSLRLVLDGTKQICFSDTTPLLRRRRRSTVSKGGKYICEAASVDIIRWMSGGSRTSMIPSLNNRLNS